MNLTLAWSTPTMLLYIVMGLIGALCIKYNSASLKYKNLSKKCISAPYIFLFFTWEAFAVFRLVRYPIGGADAAAYARYFVNCFHPVGDWETNYCKMSSRLETLLGMVNMTNRFNNVSLEDPFNCKFDEVDSIIEKKRKTSLLFLKNALRVQK